MSQPAADESYKVSMVPGGEPDWLPEEWHEEVIARLSGLRDDDRETITGAVALGWMISATIDPNDKTVTMISPDEKTKIHFAPGRTPRPDRPRRTLVRHGSKAKLDELIENEGDIAVFDANPLDMVNVQLVMPAKPEPKPRKAPAVYVVETQPMLAKSRKDRGYQSKIAIERTWSDGSVDYKCVACDYTNENRLGIRGHWQMHVRKGEVQAVGGTKSGETFKADVPRAAHYRPRQHRIEALAEFLAGLLEGEVDPEDLALAALTWVHDQTNEGSQHAGESEFLTDSEIVHRIRMLIAPKSDPSEVERLTGELAEAQEQLVQLSPLQTRVETLEAELSTITTERDRFKERAARAQGDLQSLRELVAGLGQDDEDEEAS
jgi:hypothetical protein